MRIYLVLCAVIISPLCVAGCGSGVHTSAPSTTVAISLATSLSPTIVVFPNTTVGTTSTAQILTLTNTGNESLTIAGISIAGVDPSEFAQSTTCGSILIPSTTCSMSVSFAPTSAGSFEASVTVSDNAASSPQTVTLTGTGTTSPPPVYSGPPINIVILGDSQSIYDLQISTTGPAVGDRWPDLLRDNLQSTYGSHGTGMVPLIYSVGIASVNDENWTIQGNWSFDSSIGPSQGSSEPGAGLVRMADGTAATFAPAAAFDHLNAYCASDASTGQLLVAIDGATAGQVCSQTTTAPTAQVVTSSVLDATTHAVTFTCHGSCLLYAAEGTLGTTGVSVHNIAVGTATAEWFGLEPSVQLAFSDLIPGGTQLVITDLLTNNLYVGYSINSFSESMQNIIAHEEAQNAKVLVVVPPVSDVTGIAEFPEYTQALLAVAQNNSVPFVNIQSSWGTAFDPNSGYWSPDGVHPNTLGSSLEYKRIGPTANSLIPAP